jgi:hypothetical protein
MSFLNTAMNAIGTAVAIKSLFGGDSGGAGGKYNNFLSEVRTNSVARTNLFEVTITAPWVLNGDGSARKISLYAQGAGLPGLFIQGYDAQKRFGIGPNQFMPREAQTNDTTITFIGDGKGEIYKFFYKWMQAIVPSDISVTSTATGAKGLSPYEVEYRNNYATPITLTVYNEQHQAIIEYEFTEAFPKSLPDISLNWSDSGLMTFPVVFAFTQAKLLNVNTEAGTTTDFQLSPLQKLVKIGTAVQVLSTLKSPTSVADALNVVRNAKSAITGIATSI